METQADEKARLDKKKGTFGKMSDTYKEKAKQYEAMIEAKNKDGQLDKYIEEQNAANAERMDALMKNTAEVGSKLQAGMGKMKYYFVFIIKI